MRMTRMFLAALAMSAGLAATRAGAEGPAVPFTVSEPAGVARTGEWASGGVPFMAGQMQDADLSNLVVTDAAGKSVPACFSRLASYPDGSVQWALCDLLADLPAGGKAAFKIAPGKSVDPARPLRITEAGDEIVVDTGVARFTVSRKLGAGIESAELGGTKLAGPAAMQVTAADGNACPAAPPTRVAWEYRNTIRATLRLDGSFVDPAGKPFIDYTVRLTFVAGGPTVRMVQSLRNSRPADGFDAKIRNASVAFTLGVGGESAGTADWNSVRDGKGGVLVAHRHSGGCFPGGGRNAVVKQAIANGTATVWTVPDGGKGPGYGADHFALADQAHKDTEVWLQLIAGGDASADAVAVRALREPLHVLADPTWISRTQALGVGHFGTLQDEIDTYKLWGWKGWDNAKKYPRAAVQPDAYVPRVDVHDESESDSVECFLLMYLRTGEAGFFDQARAWAGFYKTHYAYRTDGYVFGTGRKSSALKVGWYGPKEYGWSDSRSEYCHFYGRGIFDWYCLTGDVDALEAGKDMVEEVAEWARKYKAGGAVGYYGCRGFARIWLGAIRLGQLGDAAGRKLADEMGQIALHASDWDDRGFFFWGAGPSYMAGSARWMKPDSWPEKVKAYCAAHGIAMDAQGILTDKAGNKWPIRSDGGTWQQATFQMAFERWYRMGGNEQARARAIRMAEFARDCQFSVKCQQTAYYTIIDFPEKGKVYDPGVWLPAHANCPGDGAVHDGHYTRFTVDVAARAYTLTGDAKWLDFAKTCWNRGSKRGYQAAKQSAPDDEVYVFAYYIAPKDDTVLSSARLFYEYPRMMKGGR
ncbi:MAG: hypothetical protein BIFFINMI_00367 [Phycisphaerae bacterium]|nr:hypothetical protein [Phycisphaerae bacterium]